MMGVKGETRVTGASKEGEGGGEDVTMAGQTNKRTRKDRANRPRDARKLR